MLSSTNFYFSNLVDRYKLSAILWCALRNKVGHITVNINELASLFNVKAKTIRKHLNDKRFFRSCYRTSKNTFTIYLVSIKVIRAVTRLGVKWECSYTNVKDIVQEARLATTLGLQKRLRKAKIRKNRATNVKTKVVRHDVLFDNNGNLLSNANKQVMHYSKKSNILFINSATDVSGATQSVIGKELKRCNSTIRSALKSASKVRLYRFSPEYYMQEKEAQFIDSEEGTKTSGGYYKFRNYTFKACPTVYYPCIDLLGYYK
jgi:hypothetical protein